MMDQLQTDEREIIAAIRLARSENVGAVTFRQCLELFGTAEKALESLPMMASRRKRPITICNEERARKELEFIKERQGSVLIYGGRDYPRPLAQLDDPPSILTILGHEHLLRKKCVAIVGTRNASANARLLTRNFAQELTQAGYIVVSGMARGVDTAAHKGALEGGTVAVLAGGVDHIYPPENQELYHAIVKAGAVVSEVPIGVVPRPQSFPRRNRIISGLSLGVLVVEAPLRSGSLITARCAADQGRDVFAIPGSPMDPRSKGPNRLLRDGAHLVECSEDIIQLLEGSGKIFKEPPQDEVTPPPSLPQSDELERLRREILSLLSPTSIKIDVLIRETGASHQAVTYVLLELELEGRLIYHHGHQISLRGA